jgi:hypothetical protein
MQYLVAYYDTNGVGRLVGAPNDFAERAAADARIVEIKGGQTKEHKVDYGVVPYEPGRKAQTMVDSKIAQ